jgi:hypothetical protein
VAVLIRVLTEGTQHLMTQREILNAAVYLVLNCYTDRVLVQFGVIILHVLANKQLIVVFRLSPCCESAACRVESSGDFPGV